MKIKVEDFIKRCNCRSVGECDCNTFSEMDALEALVNLFAKEMKKKLRKKFMDGYTGWDMPSKCPDVSYLIDHAKKGDMVDVANIAAMIWNRNQNK